MARVLLIGATGATGKRVLAELLEDPAVSQVTTVTRRPLDSNSPKLKQLVVEDFDKLESTPLDEWKGNEFIINTLGTTRAIAGSGEAFVKVERDYSQSAMRMAKQAGIDTSITVSAMGANPNVPGPLWFHPLLYTKTLGEKEAAALGFKHTVIFQPGMLDRETEGEPWWYSKLPLSRLPVSTLAKAVLHAVKATPVAAQVTRISGNSDITRFASGANL